VIDVFRGKIGYAGIMFDKKEKAINPGNEFIAF
jgi:hypothetical protein